MSFHPQPPPQSESLDVEFAKKNRLFQELLLLAPAEALEPLIPVDEAEALFADYDRTKARRFLLGKCLCEVQKAGFALGRWLDYAEAVAARDDGTSSHRQLVAVEVESLIAEQSVWQRKLAEVLVHLIAFAGTNSDAQFYAYLLVADLERVRRQRKQEQDYFDCDGAALREHDRKLVTELEEMVRSGEIRLTDCWYLDDMNLKRVNGTAVRLITSTTKMIDAAFASATHYERSSLGYCLHHGFSTPSEAIHFTPIPVERRIDIKRFKFGAIQTGRLGIAVVARALDLLGITIPGRLGDAVVRAARATGASPFVADVGVGDFVVVISDPQHVYLAEVLETRRSRHDNESVRVRYLDERPLPNVAEDAVMLDRVHVYQRRAELLDAMPRQWEALGEKLGVAIPFEVNADLDDALRHGIVTVWTQVSRAMYLKHLAGQSA